MDNIENALSLIRMMPKKRIGEVELLLGNGDKAKGKEIISLLLRNLIRERFLSPEIGRIVNRDRHTIHQWYKRYNLKLRKYGSVRNE